MAPTFTTSPSQRTSFNLLDLNLSGLDGTSTSINANGFQLAVNHVLQTGQELLIPPAPNATAWDLGTNQIQLGGAVGKGARHLTIRFLPGVKVVSSGWHPFVFGGMHPFNNGVSSGSPITTPQTTVNADGATAPFTWYPMDNGLRSDSAGTTLNSATVTDASIGAGDLGSVVQGTGIPPGAYVGTVTAGVSFQLSASASRQIDLLATANGSPTITLTTAYHRGSQSIKLRNSGDATTLAAALAATGTPGADGYCYLRCMQCDQGLNGQPVAECNRIISVDVPSRTVFFERPLTKTFKDIIDTGGHYWIFGIALDTLGLMSVDVKMTGLSCTNMNTRPVDFNGCVLDGRFENFNLTGRSAWLPRGRHIVCEDFEIHLTPNWASLPIYAVFSPFWGGADTGSSDILFNRFRVKSSGVAAFHCLEGLADIVGRDCQISCPAVDPNNGGAAQAWATGLHMAAFPLWNIDMEIDLTNSPTQVPFYIQPAIQYAPADIPIDRLRIAGRVKGNFSNNYLVRTGLSPAAQVEDFSIEADFSRAVSTGATLFSIVNAPLIAPGIVKSGADLVDASRNGLPANTIYAKSARNVPAGGESVVVHPTGLWFPSGAVTPDSALAATATVWGTASFGRRGGWKYPSADRTHIYALFGQMQVPSTWARMNVYLEWTNMGAGSGNVSWVINYGQIAIGGSGSAADVALTTVAAAGAQDILTETLLTVTSLVVDPTKQFSFRIERNNPAVGDTLTTSDVALSRMIFRSA